MTNEELDAIVADLRDEAKSAAASEGDYYADQFAYHGCGEAADAIEWLRVEIARLREAIRRLADQDATLSVCEGNVTVTMDATLTDAERGAVERAADALSGVEDYSPDETEKDRQALATLRGLLERMRATNKTDGYVE